jgi:hypothetical protein
LALVSNTTASHNTATGQDALYYNTTGEDNIGLGFAAGYYLTTGSNNIEIGNPGAKAEANTIRIGTQGTQTNTYIAGISAAVVVGSDVVVSSTGRLGIVMSSARYKRNIADMGDASHRLMKLRPVTFRYKNDQTGALQYGLVAEEVARVYPELVTVTDGRVEAVRYHELIPMLLNELQKQARDLEKQTTRLQNQTGANERQAEQIKRLSAQMAQEKSSTDRKIAELEASHERELRAMQQRLSALERSTGTGAPVPVKF